MKKEWLTVQEAADHLGVARATVYKWAKEGRLPIYKLGERVARIRMADLQRLLVRARPLYENRRCDTSTRETILKKTKGAWAGNPAIDRAMAEINRGWNEWAEKS
ncbi:MAG: helix-turn-helix domain-containing protein [Desulfotomaculales bacterium]